MPPVLRGHGPASRLVKNDIIKALSSLSTQAREMIQEAGKAWDPSGREGLGFKW